MPAKRPTMKPLVRRHTINLYLSGEDLDSLDAIAAEVGGSRSDALRHLMDSRRKKIRKKSADPLSGPGVPA
jgi:hypothetical protein